MNVKYNNIKWNKICQSDVLHYIFTNKVSETRHQTTCILENSWIILNYSGRIPFLLYIIRVPRKQSFHLGWFIISSPVKVPKTPYIIIMLYKLSIFRSIKFFKYSCFPTASLLYTGQQWNDCVMFATWRYWSYS